MAASILNHASGILTASAGFVVGDGTGLSEHVLRGEPDVRVNLTAIASQGKDAIGQEVSARRKMTLIFQHIKLTRSTFPTFPLSAHSMFVLSNLTVELVEEGC